MPNSYRLLITGLVISVIAVIFIHPASVLAICQPFNPATCVGMNQCSTNSSMCCTTPAECLSLTGGSFSEYYSGLLPDNFNQELTSINGIINTLVPIIITLAGLILFLMLIAGGFQMLTSASNPEAAKAGQQRLTTALVGFLIIFAAYWIVQIVEIILGVNIFGGP